ncbi:hypothetical protein [Streptomyces sp. NPDC096311]|uniref:hypothetical protein n=1 Tax=Streptomyces sp. NPDC096311 TaxID=3366083 RepID=UPI00382211B8
MSAVVSADPRSGAVVEAVAEETSSAEVARLVAQAAPALDGLGRSGRAVLLRAVAEELESRRARIVELGVRETALPAPRIEGELTRTGYQARLFAGLPTGVLVSWAQHHGGPWPATNTLHTSVGTTAIRRFLRPVTWQDVPEAVLPEELSDGPVEVPRRVDGRLVLPGPAAGADPPNTAGRRHQVRRDRRG